MPKQNVSKFRNVYPEVNISDKRKNGNSDSERAVKIEEIQREKDNSVIYIKSCPNIQVQGTCLLTLINLLIYLCCFLK